MFADDNFKFDENGRKFSKHEKTLGKGEIASYKRLVLQTCKNQGLFGKGLKEKTLLRVCPGKYGQFWQHFKLQQINIQSSEFFHFLEKRVGALCRGNNARE